MTEFFNAFISYGRADSKEFALKLQTSLNKHGFKVWFDFNDIPLGVDFQNQIDDGIEKADNFLFVISPHSINSPYCLKEIELAIKCNKRIIPLLHVDEISWETWQQRFPNGSLQDWEAYKAQGKHTSFMNMHPSIGKINWVYFQEDKNDFDNSLADLIDLLGLHKDYVQQHTRFLNKALEWERNQKQTSYLLVGEEKQLAQNWLKIRFCEQQPPCVPSDLHCEYITESIKNGNNLMTQVFLSYAEEDRAMMEKIRASLRREGITVWTNTTDIHTGEDFVNSIKRGIEFADNLVYLLSPDSIKSNYTQQELDLAVEFNKRIIPLQVQKTDNLELPSALQDLQYIDFTDNLTEADYQVDESELLKILYEDAAYYNEHKILLTKALKWKQQNHNPSILLRGYNLHSAKTWLEVAQKRTQHPPIPLQSEFITASLQQPPLESLDVFISYSRADSDLARKLNDALELQGKTTCFDQESVTSASDFEKEIKQAIEASDNFLFILSPHSANSPDCKFQVEYAASLNKRCITVVYQQVNTSDLHSILSNVHWIDFNSNKKDFNANFNQLLRTLETDRQHVQSHSKWLKNALEWKKKNKNSDLLLRGSNFIVAQNWLKETEEKNKKPAITSVQKEFIQASQKAIELEEEEKERQQAQMLRLQEEKREEAEARLAEQEKSAKKQKRILKIIGILGMAAFIFAIFAFVLKGKAEKAQLAQLDSISKLSLKQSDDDLKFDALLEAISAGKQIKELDPKKKQLKTRSSILTALQTAVYDDGFREQNRLEGHKGTVFDVAWSPNCDKIATASGDGTIKLWNSNGEEIDSETVGEDDEVYSVSFYPDGETIAFTSDKNVGLWNTSDGNFPKTKSTGKKQDVKSVKSPDGKITATIKDNKDNTVELQWNNQGNKSQLLEGHKGSIQNIRFSPDGKKIATASEDNTVRIWSLSKNKLEKLKADNEAKFSKFARSPDGKTIASVNEDKKTIKLWNKQWKESKILTGHQKPVTIIAFSPDGNFIASGGEDNKIKLWNKNGKLIETLEGHDASIASVAWSPDGNIIASGSEDNTIKLWDIKGEKLKTLKGHNTDVVSVAFTPAKTPIASASNDMI